MRIACLLIALAACGETPPAREPQPEPAPKAAIPPPKDVKGMKVYDARGGEQRCAPPERDCPPRAPEADFEERCRLAGFRVQICGCEAMCTGRGDKQHYDADGNGKSCAPEGDCTPPAASAAFQDACADRGFKLKVCGCEWLCSGNPKP